MIGKEHWLLDATRAELIHALIGRGYVRHLLLSHDCNRDHEMRYGGGRATATSSSGSCPACGSCGVSEEEIRTMMVDNPARAFARV